MPDGTYVGTPTLGVAGALVGDADTAITLAAGQRMDVTDDPVLSVADSFSVEFWFKRGTTGTVQAVIDKGSTAYLVYFGSDNTLRFATSGAGVAVTSSAAITNTTLWHHCVVTKSGATAHIYIDGANDDHAGTPATFANSTAAFRVGAESSGSSQFIGSVDEVALYDYPLTAAQVLTHYQAGSSAGSFQLGTLAVTGTAAIGFAGVVSYAGTLAVTGTGAIGPEGTVTYAGTLAVTGSGLFGASPLGPVPTPNEVPFPVLDIRVNFDRLGMSRLANDGFETDTAGWSVAAGIQSAATDITRIGAPYMGTAAGRLVTTSTSGSGVKFVMSSVFTSGITYRFRVLAGI